MESSSEKAEQSWDAGRNDDPHREDVREDETQKKRLHTHYDNLKVARNAPPEVIRAAYRVLAQKYHPDFNPGNSEAVRIMKIINASYEVLSDSNKRQEHDLWIARCERSYEEPVRPVYRPRPSPTPRPAPSPSTSTTNSGTSVFIAHFLRNWFWYSMAAFVLWNLAIATSKTPQPGPKPYQASPAPVRPAYAQPTSAPNGQPWPTFASYITGYPRLHTSGLSQVTIDNSQNDSSVFIKLISLSGAKAYPVRTFYIPSHGRFTLNHVDAGKYDIRYRNLRTGGLSRAQAFDLEETPTYDGTQFSNITMTLYKVRNGNMQTYSLSEDEF